MSDADGRDRISVHGELLDEVVVTAAEVHVERLDVHRYRLLITGVDGGVVELEGNNLVLRENTATPINHGPASLHCGQRWGRPGQEHTCTAHPAHRGQHRCDCGEQERNGTVRGARGR